MPSDKSDLELMVDEMLVGNVSPEQVRNKMFERDQATPDRGGADENLRLLERPDVKDYFEKNKNVPGMYEGYERVLSFAAFHVAQREAMANGRDSIKHLEASLEAAKRGAVPGYDSWIDYIKGTLAYMQGDIPLLEKCSQALPSTGEEKVNKHVLGKLLAGLRKNGLPDYGRDYSS